jgi:hypothetical protein
VKWTGVRREVVVAFQIQEKTGKEEFVFKLYKDSNILGSAQKA